MNPEPDASMATGQDGFSTTARRRPGQGNHRTGKVRGTKSGLRRGTLEWRKDEEILARIPRVVDLTLQGQSADEAGIALGVSRATVYEDLKRSRELGLDAALGSLTETVGQLRWARRAAEQAFIETKEASLNRSAYLNTYRQTVMDEAKLLGQEPKQKVEQEITLHNGDRELDLLRPGVRERVEALYDALDADAYPASSGPAGSGPGVALSGPLEANRAGVTGGDVSA